MAVSPSSRASGSATLTPPARLDIGPAGAIAFYRTDDSRDNNTPFLVWPDGTHEVQLDADLPAGVWSPDGTTIAFPLGNWDDGKIRPALMRSNGNDFRVLDAYPDLRMHMMPAAWSPDGTRLFVTTGGKDVTPAPADSGLWSLRVSDGGDLKRLAHATEDFDVAEAFTPSRAGTKVLIHRTRDVAGRDLDRLSVADIDGSNEIQLPVPRDTTVIDLGWWDLTSESWSPNGDRIAFCTASTVKEETALWTIHPDGTGLKQIVSPKLGGITAQWSPDGDWIATTTQDGMDNEIAVVAADGTGLRKLTTGNDGWISILPRWSPNGESLIFQRKHTRPGPVTLWSVRLDGTDLRQLSPVGLANDPSTPTQPDIFGWVGGYVWWPPAPER